jgi:fructose-1,6-bisphosphatase/inositol monophosphatase family enzyme
MSEIKNEDIKDILYQVSTEIILPKYQKLNDEDIKLKDEGDLVTSVDIMTENKLKIDLMKLLPNSLFVGEESFSRNPKIIENYDKKNFCWTVDPIDGTSNYIKGKEKFAIMVALTFKEKIIQSWIYKPLTGEFSYAKLGEGAYINEKKIINNLELRISDSIGSISSKYWSEKYEKNIFQIKSKFSNTNSYRCIGFEYVDIAKGIRNFTILSKLSPWDHIPGILLVKESGGYVKHFDESLYNHTKNSNNLIVTNSNKLLNEILNLVRE